MKGVAAAGGGLLHVALSRREYVAHPILLTGLLGSLAGARLASGPLRRAFVALASEMKTAVCHARGIARARAVLARHDPLRLHVGCGARRLSGWCNVDLGRDADLRVDVRRGLPVPDGSCAEIYAEHLLEHLAFPGEVEVVLRDWHRALAPGGRLSVGVPDVAPSPADYASGGRDRFVPHQDHPSWVETALDAINCLFRQPGLGFGLDHLYAYDLLTLAARLESAGFTDIEERPFDSARDSRPGTLYVDARKS